MAAEAKRVRNVFWRCAAIFAASIASPVNAEGASNFAGLLTPSESARDLCRGGTLAFVIERWREPQRSMTEQAFGPVDEVIRRACPPELRGLQLAGCDGDWQRVITDCADEWRHTLPCDQPVPGSYGGETAFSRHLQHCMQKAAAVGPDPVRLNKSLP